MMNKMGGLSAVSGQEGILALIELMRNWDDIRKVLTDFEAFRVEYNKGLKDLNEQIEQTNIGRKVLDDEIAKFHQVTAEQRKELEQRMLRLGSKEIEVDARATNLEAWEVTIKQDSQAVSAREKLAETKMVEAMELSTRAKKMLADAESVKQDYTDRLQKF